MKKAMVFSILSLFIVLPIVFLMMTIPELDTAGRMTDLSAIIFDQMHFFEKNVEYDLEKIMFIAGKRSMVSLTNNVIINGTPVFDSISILEELVEQGTYQGSVEPLMEENNIAYWSSEMASDAESIGFNLSFTDVNVSVSQPGFSSIYFNINGIVNLTDLIGEHILQRITQHGLNISIFGFEDPLYPLNTFGRIKRIFRICNQSPVGIRLLNATYSSGSASGETVVRLSSQSFANISSRNSKILITDNASASPSNDFKGVVAEFNNTAGLSVPYLTGAENALEVASGQVLYMDSQSKSLWNLNGLENMIESKCYHNSTQGPSFLGRAEGKFSGSSEGLVSFVDLVELSSNGISLKTGKSVVDYKYFQDSEYPGYNVRGIQESWFRLDNESALVFGVQTLLNN